MTIPALVLAGFAASLGGSSRPVTARLTYSAKQAAQGGLIFAAAAVSASDEDAVRMSQAVILTSGGLLSRGAAWARAHGAPAVVLSQARWDAGRLVVEEPSFGPPQRGGAWTFEPVSELKPRALEEGEVVTVDAAAGTVTVYPPDDQQRELELAQALEAYQGLRDGQALIHWWQGRQGEPGAAALGLRLLRELAARAVDGEGRAQDAAALSEAVESSLPAAARAGFRRDAARAVALESRRGQLALQELKKDLSESSSQAAARALGERAASLCGALVALEPRAAAACRSAAALVLARSRELSGRPEGSWQQACGARERPSAELAPAVYAQFVADAGLEPSIDDLLSDASLPLGLKSRRIRALFSSAQLSRSAAAQRALDATLAGDGPFDFFCGEDEREGVAKADAPRALLDCWAGDWAPGPLGRRMRAGSAEALPRVEVAPALKPSASGEVYSREPGGPDGRALVAAGGDQYVLGRDGRPLLPPILAGERAGLSPEQLSRLARVARALGDHFGRATAASFAFEGGQLYLTAARPLELSR